MTDDGWDGVHLGEATAHAWLDGALPPDEAARAAAHVATCADCTALVAEARGLIAGASRILGALDAVPAGVLPAGAAPAPTPVARAPRRWWTGVPARAAAALLLLAGGSAAVLRERDGAPRSATASQSAELAESRAVADSAAVGGAPAAAPAMSPAMAPAMAPAEAPPAVPASPPVVAARRAARAVAADIAPPAPPPAPIAAPMAAPMPAPAAVAGGLAVQGEARRESAAKAAAGAARATDAMVDERRAAAPLRERTLVGNLAAPDGLITGRVVSPDGRPIPEVRVQVEGTPAGTLTDSTGAFRVLGPARGLATLRARRPGYDPGSATVAVTGADTARATIVLQSSTPALGQVVATAGAASSAAWRDAARGAVGCWAVRPARGWTAAAPALPDVVRLERAGGDATDGLARVADEPGRAAWRVGRWAVADTSAITVTLPATGGAAELALRRAGPGWRGTATWAAPPPATRAVAPVEVRLAAARCPAP